METYDNILYLQSIICKKKVCIEDVLTLIQGEYTNMILGFTPCLEELDLFESQLYDGGDDYRLFYYGENLKKIETEKLYFLQFSHA